MYIDAVSVGLIVQPFTFEDIAVNVPELSLAAGFIKSPIAFIFSTIFPYLNSIAVLQITEPLAYVCCAIFKMYFWSLLQLRLINFLHVKLIFELSIQHVVATHVVVVLRIQFTELSTYSLTCDHASGPRLQTNYELHILVL